MCGERRARDRAWERKGIGVGLGGARTASGSSGAAGGYYRLSITYDMARFLASDRTNRKRIELSLPSKRNSRKGCSRQTALGDSPNVRYVTA